MTDIKNDVAEERRVLKLHGQIAIVTGSDSGIGRAIAEAFSLEGADVVVTFHSDEGGALATAAQIAAVGRRSFIRRLDQREERSVVDMFEAVRRDFGEAFILVNCPSRQG